MSWGAVAVASRPRFIGSAIRMEYRCVSTFRMDRPATLRMRSHYLTGFKYQAVREGDRVSAAAGCWRTRATMPNTFDAITTATEHPLALHETQTKARPAQAVRQAGKKFWSNGLSGLHHAVFTTLLFVHCITPDCPAPSAKLSDS